MRNDQFSRRDEIAEESSVLYQRTEELYQIPDAVADKKGQFIANVLLLREVVVLPRMISPVLAATTENLLAIEDAQDKGETMVALTASDDEGTSLGFSPDTTIGIEVAAGRIINLADNNNSVLIQGRRRVKLINVVQILPFMRVRVEVIEDAEYHDRPTEALMRTARDLFERCVQMDRSLPDEAHLFSLNIEEPGWLADMIATAISLPFE